MKKNIWFVIIFISLFSLVIIFYSNSQEQRQADGCLKCHAEEDLSLNKIYLHPLIKEGKCKACHISYNETTHRERDEPTLEVCISCHSQDRLGRTHPVGQGITDPNTASEMTCVSSCHLPHGSDYKYQLPFKNNMELCLSCHKDF